MDQVPKLRYIDPYERRGRLYLAICRFSTTKVGLWLAANVAWKLDPLLLKLTRGRLNTTGPVAAAVLETRGARTGRPRRNATLYFHDGERVTIVVQASIGVAWSTGEGDDADAMVAKADAAMYESKHQGLGQPKLAA